MASHDPAIPALPFVAKAVPMKGLSAFREEVEELMFPAAAKKRTLAL
jgi:hypothetical protein